jgi:acyl CoA:acetate/3-ketoacid CoA transferase beta subunit
MGVFDIDADGFTLVELMPGVSLRDIQNHTEADFKISSGL